VLFDEFEPCNDPFDGMDNEVDKSFPRIKVGIEVEVENCPRRDIPGWEWHEENSLRSEYPSEYVTNGAHLAGHTPAALKMLFDNLAQGHRFDDTCSTHVHVNVRGMTANQLGTLFSAYYSVEALLFTFAGVHRRKNNYCVPWSDVALGSTFDLWSHSWLFATSEKYAAMNLANVRREELGTVEFRHWPGLSDRSMFCLWVKLITRLVEYAFKTPYEAQLARMKDLKTNSNVEAYVGLIFGNMTHLLKASQQAVSIHRAVKSFLAAIVPVKRFIPCSPASPLSLRLKLTKGRSVKNARGMFLERAGPPVRMPREFMWARLPDAPPPIAAPQPMPNADAFLQILDDIDMNVRAVHQQVQLGDRDR